MKKQPYLYRLKNVSFAYPIDGLVVPALSGISVDIPKEALVVISGPSGSGKSTLLNLLGLIESPQEGTIFFESDNLKLIDEKRKCEIRRFKIGFIFQQFHLIPVLTAEENIEYFLRRHNLDAAEIKARTKETLKAVGLWEHRKKKPSQLSGGQKQRVAIARALAKKPHVIIADEPTASLDQKTGKEIMELLAFLVQKHGVSIVLTSHDPMVHSYATHAIEVCDGKLVQAMEEEHAISSIS